MDANTQIAAATSAGFTARLHAARATESAAEEKVDRLRAELLIALDESAEATDRVLAIENEDDSDADAE